MFNVDSLEVAVQQLGTELRCERPVGLWTEPGAYGILTGSWASANCTGCVAAWSAVRYSGLVRIGHKGLRALHERDDRARLPPDLAPRIRRILLRLQEARNPGSADAPGFRLHPLKGDRAGWWSVRVSGNWRIVFRFEHAEVVDVDLIDYH